MKCVHAEGPVQNQKVPFVYVQSCHIVYMQKFQNYSKLNNKKEKLLMRLALIRGKIDVSSSSETIQSIVIKR